MRLTSSFLFSQVRLRPCTPWTRETRLSGVQVRPTRPFLLFVESSVDCRSLSFFSRRRFGTVRLSLSSSFLSPSFIRPFQALALLFLPPRPQIKSYNGRNNFVLPWIVQIPYYVFLGCSRSRDISKNIQAFDVDSGNLVGLAPGLKTPASPFAPLSPDDEVPELQLGPGQGLGSAAGKSSSGKIMASEEEEVVVDIGGPPR